MIEILLPALLLFQSGAPTDTQPRYTAGVERYRANDCAAALREFAASQEASENAPSRALYQGVCLAKQGEWATSEKLLTGYTAVKPDEFRGWYWLAQTQLYQKQFSSARESITKAIAIDSKSAEALRTLGEIELEMKNHQGAYRAWIQANQLDPGDARTTYYLGRLFFEADFLNEAAAYFRQTLKASPRHFAAMTYLGMCAERLNMESTAIDLYRAAIRESKQQGKPFPWAYTALAKLLRQHGKEPEAVALLEESEKTCPEAHGLTILGQLLAAANQNARAEAVLRRAIEHGRHYPRRALPPGDALKSGRSSRRSSGRDAKVPGDQAGGGGKQGDDSGHSQATVMECR